MTVETTEVVQHKIRRRKQDGTRRVIRLGQHPPEIAIRTDAECRLWAVEIATDMEMGYYVDPEGHQWDARPFVIAQMLRHMGYASLESKDRPVWWPGTETIRRMVSLKKMLREAQSKSGSSGLPWLDASIAATAEEVLDRLYGAPKEIGMRELVEMLTKLARLREQHRGSGTVPLTPGSVAPLPGQSIAMQRITETIYELEPGERERVSALYEKATAKALESMRASVPEDE